MEDNKHKNPDNQDNPLIPVQTTDWNKERLETLKKMFPDLFTNEGQLNINELKKVVDPDSVAETERYEFRWFGKSNAKRKAFTPSNTTLIYDEQRSVNPAESENLIIEGENLEVLKLLSGSYREKVKCIYIDPPYNTGNDFVYSDNYTQDKKAYWEQNGVFRDGLKVDTHTESSGRFHSDWLNMMYSRLLIARQLLKEDGVIFLSIDDNEIHHLRKLCDEVFGEENFIANLVWEKKKKASFLSNQISNVKEYVLVYSKNSENAPPLIGELNSEEGTYPCINPPNKRGERTFRKGMVSKYKNRDFELDANTKISASTMDIIYKTPLTIKDGILQNDVIVEGNWRYTQESLDKFNDANCLYFTQDLYIRRIVDDERQKTLKDLLPRIGDENEESFTSINIDNLFKDGWGSNEDGAQELRDLFENEVLLDYPKPKKLIAKLIASLRDKDLTILDFFAGSGTTGHSVSALNQLDGGNRKYILVQLPEQTDPKSEAHKAGYQKISDITIERNKRVIEKIIEEKKNQQPNLFKNSGNSDNPNNSGSDNLGFKVFKLTKSNFPRVEFAPDPEKTDEENIALLKKYMADKEDQMSTLFNRDELLTEIVLKNNFTLNYKAEKQEQFKNNEILHVTDGEKETLICLDVTIAMETVEHFKTNTEQKFICLQRALDTTKKYNLKHYMGDKFITF